jgi:D-lyxose ketol-isomerase
MLQRFWVKQFHQKGLFLFTIRNGSTEETGYEKPIVKR